MEDSPKHHPQEPKAVGVTFRRGGKVYSFAPNGVRANPGDHVLAKTERGVDLGEVVVVKHHLDKEERDKPLKPLVRRATREDLRREERLREREKEAEAVCGQKIAEHSLPMKLIDADYTFDGQRLVFFFSAEGRVDFRALVRDLAETFHCRIELRQIGVRDEAKMVGGLGPCGRPLCCAQWLRTFDPVGIKVAKDQGMPLNPAKISGICDRLMCCLRFEHEVYKELASRLPQTGDEVRSQGRVGTVRAVALLREMVTVQFVDSDSSHSVEIPAKDLKRMRGHWLLVAEPPEQPPAGGTAGAGERPDRPGRGERAARAERPERSAPPRTEEGVPEVTMREPRRGRRARPQEAAPVEPAAQAPEEPETREAAAPAAPVAGPAESRDTQVPAPAGTGDRRRRRGRRKRRPGGEGGEAGDRPIQDTPTATPPVETERPAGPTGGSPSRPRRRPAQRAPQSDGEAADGPAPATGPEPSDDSAQQDPQTRSSTRRWRRRRPSRPSGGPGAGPSGGSGGPDGG